MRTSLPLVIALLFEAVSGIATLRGQTREPSTLARLRHGTGIRVTPLDSSAPRFSGRIDSIAGDTIVVRSGTDSTARLYLNDVSRLEAFMRGRNATEVRGTFFTIGAVAGASMYVSWCVRNAELCRRLDYESKDCDKDDDEDEDDDGGISLPPIFTLMTFGTGAVLGGLAYALVPKRWEQIKLPLRVGIAPASRGVLVYASLSFR